MKRHLVLAASAAVLAILSIAQSAEASSLKKSSMRQPGSVMLNPQPLPPGPCRTCGTLKIQKHKQLWRYRHYR